MGGGSNSTIVEEWHEGSEWYRVWSNGLIEQGGSETTNSGGGGTITFKKPFSSSDYSISGMLTGSSDSVVSLKISSNTNTSVTLKATWQQNGGGGALSNASFVWNAIGF